jgi:hypothetical protein
MTKKVVFNNQHLRRMSHRRRPLPCLCHGELRNFGRRQIFASVGISTLDGGCTENGGWVVAKFGDKAPYLACEQRATLRLHVVEYLLQLRHHC